MSNKVSIEPSGHKFEVDEGEVVLDAAIRHGLSIPYGCRNGVCGACKGKVVEGQIHYEDGLPGALTETEAAIGQVLCCKALIDSDVVLEIHEVSGGSDIPIRKMPVKVAHMERLADDVMLLKLKLPDTERMQFLAGQYIDILPEDDRRRSFSIANPPHDDEFVELHVRLVEGGEFTNHIFSDLKEKDILRIEGPFGQFYLREESAKPKIFIAGGTGFAPVKGIIEHAFQEGIADPVYLYWGVRREADLYMNELAESWLARDNFSFIPVLSELEPDDKWAGRRGFVHEAVLKDFSDLAGYEVYASGPPVMVDAVREGVILNGLPKEHFYFDSFDFTPK
ncbi:CDP-6-deoxy-delta-3,4-glucoseen reductase [Pseudomonadota bacterium]